MSKLETPMTRWYWQQVGGTLIEEFCAVSRREGCSYRLIDGVIIKGGAPRIATKSEVQIEGADIIVVHAKARRLGMYVMGQALFSAELMKRFSPRSVESVALVLKDDAVLRPLFEAHPGMHVVVCPAEIMNNACIPKAWLDRQLTVDEASLECGDRLIESGYEPGDEIWRFDEPMPPNVLAGAMGIVIVRNGKQIGTVTTGIH